MSIHSKSSLISDPVTDITSYEIPLQSLSGYSECYYDDLAYVETTTFANGSLQPPGQDGNAKTNPVFDHDPDDEDSSSAMSHGFFLGKESIQSLSLPQGVGGGYSEGHLNLLEEGDGDTEDEGIGEIYRSNHDPVSWVRRRSDRSFKHSPEPTPRHAISQRIGNIGVICQNIGLGHRLGVLTEDASLIPKKVKLDNSHIVITEDSPVQTDICWSKPSNASSFASLIYKIDVSIAGIHNNDDSIDCESFDKWNELTDVRWPILRVYHTDDKLFVGKLRVSRRRDDLLIKIRVRTNGEIVLPDRSRHWIMGSFSKITEVTFAGYDYRPPPSADEVEVQQTHL